MDRLSDYDYVLPSDRIAQKPLEDRADSKLLHLNPRTGEIQIRAFRDIVEILNAGDLLILNDTRVTALRLFGKRPTGGQVELLLLRQREPGVFEALARPGRRLKPGSRIGFEGGLDAEVLGDLDPPTKLIGFAKRDGLEEVLRQIGETPLPPYVHERLENPERYQTVYAETGGSAAAPTAGLHFTEEILQQLRAKGAETAKVTLDVSLDTFRPVEFDNLDEHKMHGEWAFLPEATSEAIRNCRGRIVAVGTTVVRTLESFAVGRRCVEPGRRLVKLFIRPGFEFQVVDGMLTNFHMPRTTMLMLISAMAGRENVLRAYREALRQDFRFLSFGDSMLIL